MDALDKALLHSPSGHAWKNVGTGHHHGICLVLSALHSKKSCGIGEFFDLIPIIDWCHQLKLDFIQLLPLTDSETDPSPYHAVSSCALNPIFLSLHALPYLQKNSGLKTELEAFSQSHLSKKVAYEQVYQFKMTWLRAWFDRVGEKILKSQKFKEYLKKNPWVHPYALFKTLPFHPPHLPPQPEFRKLLKLHQNEVAFYSVLQYLCFLQLKKVRAHARQKSVFLMGDIPILVSAQSADAWHTPQLFCFDLLAGAPPDLFNKEGQNWGLPLYQWETHRKNRFHWWKQRLRYAENFYDLFRIDHVPGFFRIWAIPPGKSGKEGHFEPPNEAQWETQGKELLTMIASSTKMLPIAEDLGAVPDCVHPTMVAIGICGTKVMRWERMWKEDSRFIPIASYLPLNITCVSTHDTETLALWWKNVPDDAKAYANDKQWTCGPELTNSQRQEILWDSHHTPCLFHANLLQEYLAFFPELVWPNPEDERINIPGTILPGNWTYRFRPSVEELTEHKALALKIKEILFSTEY